MKNNKKYIKIIGFFLIVFNQIVQAQDSVPQISGVVLEKNSLFSIRDTNINVKNSNVVVITDAEGKFVINDKLQFPVVLVITNVNYDVKEIELFSYKNDLVVELNSKENRIDEILVTS